MELKTKHYYDDETLEFVASKFFIDNEEVDIDVYMDYCTELQKINGDCECNCDDCTRDDCCEECTEENSCNECDECEEYIDDDCGDCNECVCNQEEFTDQQIEEIKMIEVFAYKLDNVNCDCGCEMRNLLYELFSIGKNVGWNDHKCFMKELMEEALEE